MSPLEAMAQNFASCECIVVGCMDARCNQVYNGIFEVGIGGAKRLCEDRALTIDELIEELAAADYKKPIILAGDGAHLVCKAAEQKGLENISLGAENLRFQDAVGVAKVGEMMYNDGKAVTAEELLPIYLRLPQAERELRAKQNMGDK